MRIYNVAKSKKVVNSHSTLTSFGFKIWVPHRRQTVDVAMQEFSVAVKGHLYVHLALKDLKISKNFPYT